MASLERRVHEAELALSGSGELGSSRDDLGTTGDSLASTGSLDGIGTPSRTSGAAHGSVGSPVSTPRSLFSTPGRGSPDLLATLRARLAAPPKVDSASKARAAAQQRLLSSLTSQINKLRTRLKQTSRDRLKLELENRSLAQRYVAALTVYTVPQIRAAKPTTQMAKHVGTMTESDDIADGGRHLVVDDTGEDEWEEVADILHGFESSPKAVRLGRAVSADSAVAAGAVPRRSPVQASPPTAASEDVVSPLPRTSPVVSPTTGMGTPERRTSEASPEPTRRRSLARSVSTPVGLKVGSGKRDGESSTTPQAGAADALTLEDFVASAGLLSSSTTERLRAVHSLVVQLRSVKYVGSLHFQEAAGSTDATPRGRGGASAFMASPVNSKRKRQSRLEIARWSLLVARLVAQLVQVLSSAAQPVTAEARVAALQKRYEAASLAAASPGGDLRRRRSVTQLMRNRWSITNSGITGGAAAESQEKPRTPSIGGAVAMPLGLVAVPDDRKGGARGGSGGEAASVAAGGASAGTEGAWQGWETEGHTGKQRGNSGGGTGWVPSGGTRRRRSPVEGTFASRAPASPTHSRGDGGGGGSRRERPPGQRRGEDADAWDALSEGSPDASPTSRGDERGAPISPTAHAEMEANDRRIQANFLRAKLFFDASMKQLWTLWVRVLQLASVVCAGAGVGGGLERPDWVPDDEVTSCHSCGQAFSAFYRRKHHCRCCGNIFCRSCSDKSFYLELIGVPTAQRPAYGLRSSPGHNPIDGASSVRVCDACFLLLRCLPPLK